MDRRQGGRDEFFGFGDPFAGFGGFGMSGSMIPSMFGGRDPFDDPFFNRPFGSMMGPSMFPRMFGQSMLGPSMFGGQGSMFRDPGDGGFIEQAPRVNKSKGPVIEELSSEDESEGEGEKDGKEAKKSSRKHSRSSKEPYVQHPEEASEEKKSRHMSLRNDFNRTRSMPGQTFTFHSSSVTYGGVNGTYYSSSTTRRTGSDGLTIEESKIADTTTGKATHRVSRGIHDKGHSLTRKLGADGKVDTMQTLHNLNEDELPVFEDAWKGSAQRHLPGWNAGQDMLGRSRSNNMGQEPSRGWALPSTEQAQAQEEGRMRTQARRGSYN